MIKPVGVAPRVGAWIETIMDYKNDIQDKSHPVWVRGLKQYYVIKFSKKSKSHPVWVRGLKLLIMPLKFCQSSRTPCGCVD